MPNFTFFIGKGGVGKTTVSSAYATHRAAESPRRAVLLISTDPAHSLGDVLKTELSDKPARVKTRGRLFARQIDPESEVKRFLKRHREGLLRVIDAGTFFSRDEIAPLLDASLPGMAELAALLALDQLVGSDEFAEVVVDTAPMGHTLRMFEVPQHLAKFLEFLETVTSRDQAIARQFVQTLLDEHPVITEWRRMITRVHGVLTGDSRVVLVTTPEEFALEVSRRAIESLQNLGMRVNTVVLNRTVSEVADCIRCARRSRQATVALRELNAQFEDVKIGGDSGGPVLGVEALSSFGAHVFEGRALKWIGATPKADAGLEFVRSEWPRLEVPLTLVLGKGGVGKTTISAGLSVHERVKSPRQLVSLCSIDPAPSLQDVFRQEVGDISTSVFGDKKLRAAEFDAAEAFRKWADALKRRIEGALSTERGGLHIDLSFDRKIVSALLDITPPGVDEVFAVFRIRDLADEQGRAVIDMAPTGHALELLRTPARLLTWSRLLLKSLAAHRTLALAQDAAVEIATLSQYVRRLSSELANASFTRAWPVMLAEPLPDTETSRLVEELRRIGAPVGGIFVNRILSASEAKGCPRCTRARKWQLATLSGIARKNRDLQIFGVSEFARELAGRNSLQRFTRELWRIKERP